MTLTYVRTGFLAVAMLVLASGAGARNKEATASASGTHDSVAQHIATFDDLDFNVFSGQQWARLHVSHAKDIVVHWPDGHQTTGIEKHIEDLKAMFVYAPDTRIKVHPVTFC